MAKFKPEFGNETHLRVCKLLKELSDNDIKLEKKMKEVTGINNLFIKMKNTINQIVFLLEKGGVDKIEDKKLK